MSVHTRGLISHGVEDWDMEDEPHSGGVKVSIGYVVAIGMAAIESDIMLSDRVSDDLILMISCLFNVFIDEHRRGCYRRLYHWIGCSS